MKNEPIERPLSAKEKDLKMREAMQKIKGEVEERQLRKPIHKDLERMGNSNQSKAEKKLELSSDESSWRRNGKTRKKPTIKREGINSEDDIARYRRKPIVFEISSNRGKSKKYAPQEIQSKIKCSDDSEDDLITKFDHTKEATGSAVVTYKKTTRRRVTNADYFESDDTDEICGKNAAEFLFDIPLKRSNFAGDGQIKKYTDLITEIPSNHQTKCPVDQFCKFPIIIPFSKKLGSIYNRYQELLEKHENDECSLSSVILYRDKFCSYHRAEKTIIPQGIEKGYLFEIDFGALDKKLGKCLPRLKGIVEGEVHSSFKQKIKESFERLGKLKSQGFFKLISY